MGLDLTTTRSRRALLTGVLGGLGAWAAQAMGRASSVLAAGNDGSNIVVGGFYPDARSQTTIANSANSNLVLWVASNGDLGEGYGDAITGFSAHSIGVRGSSSLGLGIKGDSSYGVGGLFQGGRAPLSLEPGGTAGKPTSGYHAKGDIYMDSKGSLFICTASGNPGTWKKVVAKLV